MEKLSIAEHIAEIVQAMVDNGTIKAKDRSKEVCELVRQALIVLEQD